MKTAVKGQMNIERRAPKENSFQYTTYIEEVLQGFAKGFENIFELYEI